MQIAIQEDMLTGRTMLEKFEHAKSLGVHGIEFWGRGLATEIAAAIVRMAFDDLGLPSVIALTVPDHVKSQRVMTKVGMTYERHVMHAGLQHVLYRARRETATPQA